MISYAQVITAIATGAMLPITALLAIELHRLRQRNRAVDQIAGPPTPERLVDDDERVEAIARLAAGAFDLLAQEPDGDCTPEDSTGVRSKAHLTLITRPLRPARKRSLSNPAAEVRRPSTHRQAAAAAARITGRVRRD